ncbi:MAG: alpha,alpha-trehalase [Micavibrio aeruginosavorus]|uniref:Alpha,alpha-trehalase n=1 Tax=Micavibrio aeruginosavorus TaxID=349221 RepID=A0A2W5N353_9BACT|nr:MAG: alpha,alpha-trehalase [Micavibrio aeruginosavorus]
MKKPPSKTLNPCKKVWVSATQAGYLLYRKVPIMNKDLLSTVEDTPRILLRKDLCKSSGDPKLDGKLPPVYVPQEDFEHARKTVSNPDQLVMLPEGFDHAPFFGPDADHGLLYLPFPYLVPGGRFNEMYGWDSAFPVFAWADSQPKLIREQIDNQLYQIKAYDKVLNANRTYYLSRSQPPLLSAMVMRLWEEIEKRPWSDFDPDGIYKDAMQWLQYAYKELVKFHTYWVTGDRLADDTGLSRYWDEGVEPAPEVLSSEHGHFHHAIEFYKHNAISTDNSEDALLFLNPDTSTLTPLYHRANRAMRAAGFDPTGHWGYGALRCVFHAPACLNSLLYAMENDLAKIASMLKLQDNPWAALAKERKAKMREFLFNEDTGAYVDYDFARKRLNTKPFATLFYPLWAGLYDPETESEQIKKLVAHALEQLETPYGIVTSTEVSGSQWDYPYGWPPLQYFAFTGLARCGFMEDAKRIAQKYIDLTSTVMASNGSLYEKYNVVEGNAEVHVVNGYDVNVSERGTFLWSAATVALARKLLDSGE